MTRLQIYQMSILKTRWHKYANQLIEADSQANDRFACKCPDCWRTLEHDLDYHADGRRKQRNRNGR